MFYYLNHAPTTDKVLLILVDRSVLFYEFFRKIKPQNRLLSTIRFNLLYDLTLRSGPTYQCYV